MIKARQVLGKQSSGKIVSLHLSEDAGLAKQVFNKLRSEGGEDLTEIALLNPWGIEKHYKFSAKIVAEEIKPATHVKLKK